MAGRVSARSEGPQAPHKAKATQYLERCSGKIGAPLIPAAARGCAALGGSAILTIRRIAASRALMATIRPAIRTGTACRGMLIKQARAAGISVASRLHHWRVLISCDTDTAQLTRYVRHGGNSESAALDFRSRRRLVVELGLSCFKDQGRNRKPLNISKTGGPTLAHKAI